MGLTRGRFAVGLAVFIAVFLSAVPAQARFGVAGITTSATERDGTLDFSAGSHPYEYTIGFEMSRDSGGELEGSLRGAFFNLPPGLVGSPLAVPRCIRQDFEGSTPRCPGATQIGIVHSVIEGLGQTTVPLYNLVPPPGKVAAFGFSASGFTGLEQISLRTGRDYGLTVSDAPVPVEGVTSISETIWGVPADPGHDAERICTGAGGSTEEGCASGAPQAPLLKLPSSCTGPLETRVGVEPAEAPGVLVGASALSLDAGGNPAGLAGCEGLPFSPAVALQPNTTATSSPAGPSIAVHLPQSASPGSLATADVKTVVADLPTGMSVNLSAAAGLAGCSAAQIGLESEPGVTPVELSSAPAECPGAAKIGVVRIDTPLLGEPLAGAVYVARQGENPFGSLLALYLVAYDPASGVVIKLPGEVSLDPQTGKPTATFAELPQLPFEDLQLELSNGPRAPLISPPACGTYATRAELTPSTAPDGATVTASPSFRLSSGPGGSPCTSSEAEQPNRPSFEAGSTNVLAGSDSTFVLRLGRDDGAQHLSSFAATLPPGVAAKLAGIPYCPETALRSCPAASEVGTVNVAAGAGPSPLQIGGRVYLAGPYRGAPLSLAVVTPAVAGPFDLGTIVVRVALYVDGTTGQIRAVSDPFPTILQGIPLNVRRIAINLDRRGFIVNPTRCEPTAVTGEATSVLGNVASLSQPFQVGGCNGLAFRPDLSVHLLGPTHRGAHPALRTVVKPRSGDANLGRVAVTLPPTELLENRNIRTICSRSLPIDQCPGGSVYGQAKVWSPLLGAPLVGPVYLRGSNHRLPNLVASLGGQIHLDVTGRVSAAGGRIRTTFAALPDLPLSRFVLTLHGGKRGLLVNTGGVCRGTKRAEVEFTGQNGKAETTKPAAKAAGCGPKRGPAT